MHKQMALLATAHSLLLLAKFSVQDPLTSLLKNLLISIIC